MDDQKANITGRKLLPHIGKKILQKKQKKSNAQCKRGREVKHRNKTVNEGKLNAIIQKEEQKKRDESTVYSGRDSYPAKWPLNPDSPSRKC